MFLNIVLFIFFSINIPDGGQYKICFDNTYSHFTAKQVAFSITTINPDDASWEEFQNAYYPEEATYDVQVNEIKVRLTEHLRALF